MLIRAAGTADAAGIAAVMNREIRETLITFRSVARTEADVLAEIAAKALAGHPFLVAEDPAGRLAGLATYAQFRANDGYRHTMEHTIVVAPDARGVGLGRHLIGRLERAATAAGHHSLIAGVSSANPDGVAFHLAVGFRQVAVLPEVACKAGRWLDLVVLQKRLDGPGGPDRDG
jgi:phosphinothricin acetyltransferase